MKQMNEKNNKGSALILTVVLTSLLAIVGIMFVMAANMDKITTSSVSAKKELQFAVDSVIADISQKLIEDVPGVAPDPNAEYYDYPGNSDRWLASLEPAEDPNGLLYWPQISNIIGGIWQNANIAIIDEKETAVLNQPADADGDGVSDSRWTVLPGITSGKGNPVFAAIRIIDNGAMLNANTGYMFDPVHTAPTDPCLSDGSTQLQINLMALAGRPNPDAGEDTQLWQLRYPGSILNTTDFEKYKSDVVWRYYSPHGTLYTPFDISDELELRNRFLLNNSHIDTRLEAWGGEFRNSTSSTPFTDIGEWRKSAYDSGSLDPNYAYRHLATTYNFDRIINTSGQKMVNIKNDANSIFTALTLALTPNAAQLAVNIADYLDDNNDISEVAGRYGIEPQPFISEIGVKIDDPNNPEATSHYAVELYNPFSVGILLDDFELTLSDGTTRIQLNGTIGADGYYVIANDSVLYPAPTLTASGLVLSENYIGSYATGYTCYNYSIFLVRQVNSADVYLDRQDTENNWFTDFTDAGLEKYFERDDDGLHIVCPQIGLENPTDSLGMPNSYSISPPEPEWKFNWLPLNATNTFVTVGDISRMLIIGPSNETKTMGKKLIDATNEADVRVNLADRTYQKIFNYLTVFDPTHDGIDNDGDSVHDANEVTTPEFKIPGRININTAPWYVIAQLPWVYESGRTPNYELAKAIVAYRDKQNLPGDPNNYSQRSGNYGFESIGELNLVTEGQAAEKIDYHANNGVDLTTFPDLTASDNATDDFEERDVIFARISNLVTVRSDVFTAYILVRLGPDGPQKRVIAILDRSDVYSANDKVKVLALWPVPDSR